MSAAAQITPKPSGKEFAMAEARKVSVETNPILRRTTREDICKHLQATSFMKHNHPLFMHGRCFEGAPGHNPREIWHSDKKPRDDREISRSSAWLTASEFEDNDNVLITKCKKLCGTHPAF